MGTHPIFESDFDCLTEHSPKWEIYSGRAKRESPVLPILTAPFSGSKSSGTNSNEHRKESRLSDGRGEREAKSARAAPGREKGKGISAVAAEEGDRKTRGTDRGKLGKH